MEYVDIYDIAHNHLGIKDITTAHQEGFWHETFHCWIIRPNNKILFQLRDKNNYMHPGKLDISAAGHLVAGDKPIDGIREIKEELGLDLRKEDLRFFGTYKSMHDYETKQFGFLKDREFVHNYFIKNDTPLENHKLEASEVDGIYEIDIDEILKLFNDEVTAISATGYNREQNKFEKITVSKNDFMPLGKEYYIKLGIMAKRFINNEKYIAF